MGSIDSKAQLNLRINSGFKLNFHRRGSENVLRQVPAHWTSSTESLEAPAAGACVLAGQDDSRHWKLLTNGAQ